MWVIVARFYLLLKPNTHDQGPARPPGHFTYGRFSQYTFRTPDELQTLLRVSSVDFVQLYLAEKSQHNLIPRIIE